MPMMQHQASHSSAGSSNDDNASINHMKLMQSYSCRDEKQAC